MVDFEIKLGLCLGMHLGLYLKAYKEVRGSSKDLNLLWY